MVVMDEDTCMVDMAAAHHAFLRRTNSCGWCIPCPRRHELVAQNAGNASTRASGRPEDIDLIAGPGKKYAGAHVLPRSATLRAMPTISIMKKVARRVRRTFEGALSVQVKRKR